MQFIQGSNRHQNYFSTLELQVTADNMVRLIDAFIDKLDLQKLGFANTLHKSEGRQPYALPLQLLFKLYVRFLSDADLFGSSTIGIDGSKFKEVKNMFSKKYPTEKFFKQITLMWFAKQYH